MKKNLFILAIATVSLFSFEAKSQVKPASPSEVATGLFKSLVTLDFKNAETFVRSEDSAKLAMAEPMVSGQLASMPDSVKQIMNSLKCTAGNEKISGDSATVDVTISSDKDATKQKKETVHLIRENGVWKAMLDMKGNDADDDN